MELLPVLNFQILHLPINLMANMEPENNSSLFKLIIFLQIYGNIDDLLDDKTCMKR